MDQLHIADLSLGGSLAARSAQVSLGQDKVAAYYGLIELDVGAGIQAHAGTAAWVARRSY